MVVQNLVLRVKMPDSLVLNNVYQFDSCEFDVLEKLDLYRITTQTGTRLFFNRKEVISFSYDESTEEADTAEK